MSFRKSAAGFTLVETLVATVLVCTAVGGIAQLGVVAVAQGAAVQRDAVAVWLAQSKIEDLRSRAWSFDSGGGRISDPMLVVSAANALDVDTAGLVDYLDRFGNAVAPADAAFHRRWAISLVEGADADTLRLRACVQTRGSAQRGSPPATCVSSVRTRRVR
jgi:type II secretory pathway pseudopilin PulG